jgi:diguanylate cyclase (GGDEF)-like protein/PAS domain S-box-containing protein
MIVDDDEGVRRMLDVFVRREGFAARDFRRPSHALRILDSEAFDLAFVDINLPEMNGLELAKRLREKLPDLTIVFITGFESLESAVGAIRLGAYDYLKKPFDQNEIALTLERYRVRRRLKPRAAAAERRYSLLLQHVPVLIFLLKPDLDLAYINNACASMLGYEPFEAVESKQWLMERIHPDDRGKMRRLFLSSVDHYTPFSAEFRMLHKDGFVIHAIANSIPRQDFRDSEEDEEGSDHLLECALMDITDRVLLEQRLVQDEKLKTLGAIAAEVAHEIRNPLMAIGGFARRLQEKAPDLAESEIILREAGRLEKLLDRINSYLTPVNLRRDVCQAEDLLAEAVELLAPRIEERGLRPNLRLTEGLPEVYADAGVLRQIFVNAILNAVKVSKPEGKLAVWIMLRSDNIHVKIAAELPHNSGVNPEELLAPFSETDEHIGLALSRRLIKHMGGVLSVESDQASAAFCITLPRYDRMAFLDGAKAEGGFLETALKAVPGVKDPGAFHNFFHAEWKRLWREKRPLSLAMVGLDYFDAYRRRRGEQETRRVMDAVGGVVAGRLRRPGDFAALFTDDCFAMVLPGVGPEGAARVGWDVMEAVAGLRLASGVESGLRYLTVSVGMAACVPGPDMTPEDLICEASQALKEARAKGAGQLVQSGL